MELVADFLLQATSNGATFLQAIIVSALLVGAIAVLAHELAKAYNEDKHLEDEEWEETYTDETTASNLALGKILEELRNANQLKFERERQYQAVRTVGKMLEIYNVVMGCDELALKFDEGKKEWIVTQGVA